MPWYVVYHIRSAQYSSKQCYMSIAWPVFYISCVSKHVPHDSGKEIEDEHATKIFGQLLLVMTWHEFNSNIVLDWHIPYKQHLSMHIISIHQRRKKMMSVSITYL
jgi:hypothetical protein